MKEAFKTFKELWAIKRFRVPEFGRRRIIFSCLRSSRVTFFFFVSGYKENHVYGNVHYPTYWIRPVYHNKYGV